MQSAGIRILVVTVAWVAFIATGCAAERKTPSAGDTHLPAAHHPLSVAFVVSDHAQMIDLAGPWEVFDDTSVDGKPAFKLFTVAQSRSPLKLTGGLTVVPDYTFDDAPVPDIVVVGAQGGLPSPRAKAWMVEMHGKSQVEMSVCVGAVWLADAGLLAGKSATTHHDAFAAFRRRFPDVTLVPDVRYVRSDPVLFTSGGLTAGIDLALHIVDLYFGKDTAESTARYMEYESAGWKKAV